MLFSNIFGGISLPSASNMILYINLGVLALFLIAFLVGYIRGLFKSVFNIAASCGMVLLFFLVFPLISKALINMDLTTFGLDFDIEGIKVVSIGQFIEDYLVYILKVDLPEGVLITETFLYLTIYSVVELVLRLALLIVILVLNLTVFKFIYWVIYMIVKPRPRDEECYQRIKLTKMNRVYGGLISILNFILIMFIFCVPLSAVFSLVETAGDLVEVEENNNEKLSNKVLLSFDGTTVQLSANNRELLESFGIDGEYIDILDEYSDIYRKTIPGFIYSIPISERGLDTFVFDSLFTVEYKEKKFQFRKELQTVLEIVGEITSTVDLSNGFSSMDDILLIIDSLSEDEINNIFNKLNELEIIEFAIPLASDTFELMVRYGDEQFTAYLDFADAIAVLKDSDYKNLIGQIGKSIASAKALLDEVGISVSSIASGDFDYGKLLSAKPTSVQKVLDNIAGIELLDTVFTAAEKKLNGMISENEMVRSFMIALPEVEIVDGKYAINGVLSDVSVLTEELEYLGFEVDENNNWIILYNDEEYITNIDASNSLHMINVNGISISQELRNIGKIYESFSALGITSINQIQKWFDESVEAEDVDYSKWSKENLDALSQSIIDLQVVGKASGNVMVVVNNMLPAEYRNKIVIPESITANDLSCVLILARTVLKERLLSVDDYTKLDYKALIENNFDDLVNAIKNSDIIMDNLTPVLNVLFEMVFEGEEVIVIGDDVKWDEELENLFNGVKEILAIDIFAEKIDLSNLNVEALATALSKSKVLTSNLNNILKWAITQIKIEGFEITIPDDIVWDYDQIYSMFSAVKTVLDIYLGSMDEANELQINTLLNKLCNLTDEEIDLILSNELITKVVAALLYDQANREDGALYGMIVVNIPADDYDTWLGNDTKQGELSIILHSAKLLINGVDFNNEDELVNKIIENLTNLTNDINASNPEDDQVGQILSSIILVDTIEKYLIDFSSEENAFLVYPEGVNLKDVNGEDGELRKVITALKEILSKTEIDFSKELDTNTLINELFKLSGDDLELVVASDILLATVDKYLIDFGKEGLIAYDEESKEKIRNEIGVVFDVLKDILKDIDLNDLENINVNLIVENVCELTDEQIESLLTSKILTDTVKMYIESFSKGENAFIVIPLNVVWYDNNNKPVEVEKIIKGLRLLLNKVEIDFENIDTEALFDSILKLKGEDIHVILDSQILYATVDNYLIEFDTQGYIDYNQELDLKVEFAILIENLPKVLGEDFKFSDFENLDVNELIKNIVKLTDTELSEILSSEILSDTIIMYINDINKDGEVLVIADDTDWKGVDSKNGELYNIIKALKCIYQKQEIDFNNFDINIILDAILLLEGEDIDVLFTSSVLTDTVDKYLQDFDEDGMLVYEDVEKEELANEFKKLLGAITDVFGADFKFADLEEEIDINKIINNVAGLEDQRLREILSSKILNDTIVMYIKDINENSEEEVLIIAEDTDWRGTEGKDGEVFNIIKALGTIINNSEEELDFNNLDINVMMDSILSFDDNEVDILFTSTVLTDTVDKYLQDFNEEGSLVYEDVEKEELADEFKLLISSVDDIFGEGFKFADLEEGIDINEVIHNIAGLEDQRLREILSSKILNDTIVMYIKDINENSEEEVLVIAEDTDWRGTESKDGEVFNIIKALGTIIDEAESNSDELDFNDLDINVMMDSILSFDDNEVDTLFTSTVLTDTIDDYLQDFNEEGSLVYEDVEKEELANEFKLLISSVDDIFGEGFKFADLEEGIDINEVIHNIAGLEDQRLREVLSSKILNDTIVMYIKDINENSEEEVLIIAEDTDWRGTEGKDGEVFNMIKALGTIIDKSEEEGEELDFNNLDINVVMDMVLLFDDNEVDTLFTSTVLTDTIDDYLLQMDADEVISYNVEKENLANEFKTLLGCDHLVFGEGYKFNDLEEIDTNEVITRIVHLTNDIESENPEEDQVGMLLESRILSDTIIMYINSYSETEDSPIIMPDGNIQWYDTEVAGIKIAGELRNILGALNILFGDQEEIDLNSIDANIIRDIEEDEVDEILESEILSLTIGDILESLHVSLAGDDVESIDDLSVELKALIYGVDKIFDENTDLNAPEFDINVILDLEDEEMDRILDSKIVFDTFYYELHNLTEGDLEGILVFKPGMEETEEELIKFVNSIKVVLGDEDLTDMQEENFTVDAFIAKSDEDIEILLDSTLVRYSAALQLDAVLYGDEASLGEYIELDTYEGNRLNDRERIALIEEDLADIIKVIGDLNEKGINYTEFTYESFETVLNDGDSDENAKELSRILLQSDIITNSLDKMINRLLSDVLTDEQMEAIEPELTKDEWCENETDEGELTRILKVLIHVEQFAAEDADNSTIESPEELSVPLKAINHSLKLHGLLPTFIDTTTSNLGEWVTGDKPEDVEAWDKEIDVLSELIWKVCSLNMNLDDMEVQGNNSINPDELGYILTRVNHSVMLDIHMVGPLLEEGIMALFTDADVTIDTSSLESEEEWDEEIVKIVEAVRALQAIEDITINKSEQGKANAEAIGIFLDLCCESVVLDQAVESIIESIIPTAYIYIFDMLIESLGSYSDALVQVAGYIPE